VKTFEKNQQVVCQNPEGYSLTMGKPYTVLWYWPSEGSDLPGFTWPAYVDLMDDRGKKVTCHASRFKPID
jgi:hypothetical protein